LVREIAKYGGGIGEFGPPGVKEVLIKKLAAQS